MSPRRRLTVREKDYILAAQNNRCTICGDKLTGAVEWRAVPGFEGMYEVSSAGDVRSLPRLIVTPHPRWAGQEHRRLWKGGPLGQHCNGHGYLTVHLRKEGREYRKYVHRLVAEAFHGPQPDGHEVAHGDGTRDHNCATNLRWATPAENAQDTKRHGRQRAYRPPRKTHCPQGHAYEGENLFLDKDGHQNCRICRTASWRRSGERRRARRDAEAAA